MKIDHTLHIGAFHTKYCEDFFVVENISDNQKLIAVLDGCSQGKESVFAAILFGKILRTISKKEFYKDFVTKEEVDLKRKLKTIVREFFSEVQEVQRKLDITNLELLTTLLIGIIDVSKQSAEIIVFGDGFVYVDGKEFDFEQGDKPDYLAYHLQKSFEEWYENEQQEVSITKFEDLSITTDGIFAFKNLKNPTKQKSIEEIIQFLLTDDKLDNDEYNLDRKVKVLNQKYDHLPTDDIAIVRIKK